MQTDISITPQKISFSIPKVTNYKGDTLRSGVEVDITLDAYNVDKKQLKKDLQQIFTEVLEYFD